jgi:hypothetical protein
MKILKALARAYSAAEQLDAQILLYEASTRPAAAFGFAGGSAWQARCRFSRASNVVLLD